MSSQKRKEASTSDDCNCKDNEQKEKKKSTKKSKKSSTPQTDDTKEPASPLPRQRPLSPDYTPANPIVIKAATEQKEEKNEKKEIKLTEDEEKFMKRWTKAKKNPKKLALIYAIGHGVDDFSLYLVPIEHLCLKLCDEHILAMNDPLERPDMDDAYKKANKQVLTEEFLFNDISDVDPKTVGQHFVWYTYR